jgi:hypothetical protein
LYLLIFKNHKKTKESYENLEIDLSNRDSDNWLPLFSIAQFIDNSEGEEVNAEEQLKKYVSAYKEINIDTNDDRGDFFNILYEKIKEEKYYTPKELGEFPEIAELFHYTKSPAHKIGKLLKGFHFKQTIQTGVKKYLLSKELIKKIIDLYFNPEQTPPNSTNTTKQHQQHQMTPKKLRKYGFSVIWWY